MSDDNHQSRTFVTKRVKKGTGTSICCTNIEEIKGPEERVQPDSTPSSISSSNAAAAATSAPGAPTSSNAAAETGASAAVLPESAPSADIDISEEDWDELLIEQAWVEMYWDLKRFRDDNGHCQVPRRYDDVPGLGRWVWIQREQYKKNKLAADWVQKLNEIDFEWDASNAKDGSEAPEQPTTKENNHNNKNNDGGVVVIKREEDSLVDNDTPIKINNSKKRKQGSKMTPIKSEELDDDNDANSTRRTKRSSRRKRFNNNSDSLQKNKKKRNNNQQGRESAVVNNIVLRTSPRGIKKHQEEEERGEEEEDQKDPAIDTTTNDDCTSTNNNNKTKNCCKLCNDPDWENKIYYKCGTVLKKYFPKTTSNPNPGWYKGTIRMHYVSFSNSGFDSDSDSEYEEEAESRKSEQHCIVLNEIHYEDGDVENITQDDLKLQLMDGDRIKIMHTTNIATVSNSERHDHVDAVPPATLSDRNNRDWLKKYNSLKKYKTENGNCRVSRNYRPDLSLGRWVSKQRTSYRKGTIPPDREEKLNKLGFELVLGAQTLDLKWKEKFDRLKTYKEENGHCRVPRNYGPDPSLANWVKMQRKTYKQRKLAEDRVEKLNKLAFEWVLVAQTPDQFWQENYERVKQFKAKNGHCRVPPRHGSDPSFGNWVNKQRQHNKKGTLAPDRAEKLNKIGFDWDPYNQTWNEMFGRLEQFKTDNGHCRIPKRYDPDPSLGIWVSTQRQHYKKGKMAADHEQKLEEIDFEWDARAETWDEMFHRLEQFKAENLHCRVPQRYSLDPPLGKWVSKQRTAYKEGTLAPDHEQKLEQIDFEWDARARH